VKQLKKFYYRTSCGRGLSTSSVDSRRRRRTHHRTGLDTARRRCRHGLDTRRRRLCAPATRSADSWCSRCTQTNRLAETIHQLQQLATIGNVRPEFTVRSRSHENHLNSFGRFDTVPGCHGRTESRTDGVTVAHTALLRSVRRAVKNHKLSTSHGDQYTGTTATVSRGCSPNF